MRRARLDDHRRRLRERTGDWRFRVKSLTFEDVPTLGTGSVNFTSPLTVLAGQNGAGKTTILRAIRAAATCSMQLDEPETVLRLSSGKVCLRFSYEGNEGLSGITFAGKKISGGNPVIVEVHHIESALVVHKLRAYFCGFSGFDEITNGVGARIADQSCLTDLNYISNRDYRSVHIYEIEMNGDTVPFFEVAHGSDRYDSRTMGDGELAILNLWWLLDRATEDSLLLIEEPETFLSPRSQEHLLHHLIARCVKKRLSIVMTSHSAHIIRSLSENDQIYLFRDDSVVSCIEGIPPAAILESVGIEIPVDIIALVEDEAGAALLNFCLERTNPHLSRRIEVRNCSGDGNITKFLNAMGDQFSKLKIIGVYDGDRRSELLESVAKKATTLPGEQPVEAMFKEMVLTNKKAFETSLGRGDIGPVIASLEGVDIHDWFEGMCRHLKLSKPQLFDRIFRIWEEKEENSAAIKRFALEIERLISGSA